MNGVSIFLPVYNEERILEDHVMLVYTAVAKLGRPFEVVVVDDSSSDRTSGMADKLAKRHKEIKHVRFENGPSRRENLAVAMTRAKYPIVIFMDSDLSVDLLYIQNLILEIEKGYDVAIGSRYMGIEPHREFYRLMISRVYNKFMKIFLRSQVKDHQCGFKAIKRDVLRKLVKDMGYDSSHLRGWFWDAELLVRAQLAGYRIAEFPVSWSFGRQSSFSPKRELRMVPYILGKMLALSAKKGKNKKVLVNNLRSGKAR